MEFGRLHIYISLLFLIVQVTWGLDSVTLLNPPEEPVPDHLLKVLYSCEAPATVQLDLTVSFETGTVTTLPLTWWRCDPADPEIRRVRLVLPDWLVYQADGIVPETPWVLSCILKASVRYGNPLEVVAAQNAAVLHLRPSFSRPFKQHSISVAWGTRMLQFMTDRMKKCPLEKETVHLLSSIYASTEENFGITKTLEPYSSEPLESWRVKSISFTWCMFSIWIFLTNHCHESMCGLFYHIDSRDDYSTPLLFLTKSGQLHIQINGDSGESTAFLTSFKVPLTEWCQIGLKLHSKFVNVSMVCFDNEQRTIQSVRHMLGHGIMLDDTDGYFVIGGGKYIQGVEGYFGPMVYYRNRILSADLSEVALPAVIKSLNLSRWLRTCQSFRLEMIQKINFYLLKARRSVEYERYPDIFQKWSVKDRELFQCDFSEGIVPHRRRVVNLIKRLAFKRGGREVNLQDVGRALYTLALHKAGKATSTGVFGQILPLLLQAGCLANSRALFVASVLHATGLGVSERPKKAWLLALLAAHGDDRFALMRLGHLHHRGLHGVPSDTDLSYSYYANIAQQTTLDRHNPSSKQVFVEAVYLNNEEALKLQTNKNHHIFQWLKLQAKRGVAEAEQELARMLFWGQQGVSPDIQEAVRHYERGAVQWQDPVSMYDYGIVLLQGQGVEQDVPKAVTFLKKAADQGFVPAINALAWYYEHFEEDYAKAVQLWERADFLESPDAAMNLGVMHIKGLYPGRAADQHTAYKYFLKSAERGLIKGAVQVADIWTTGIPGLINRRPSDAVLWVQWVAEHNGYLGSVLRAGLDSYLNGNMLSSLLYYIMAAEMGYAAAQFNVAYLCDENTGGFLDPAFALHCMKKYYNLTIQNRHPATYAFIRMGDLWYDGLVDGQKSLFSAAEMYKQAALHKDPQGWYNLGLLAEERYKLPLSVLIELGLSELYLADNSTLQSALYKRCRDSDDADSFLPCSLALFGVHLQLFQKEYCDGIKCSTAVALAVAPTILFILLSVLRTRVFSLS